MAFSEAGAQKAVSNIASSDAMKQCEEEVVAAVKNCLSKQADLLSTYFLQSAPSATKTAGRTTNATALRPTPWKPSACLPSLIT